MMIIIIIIIMIIIIIIITIIIIIINYGLKMTIELSWNAIIGVNQEK